MPYRVKARYDYRACKPPKTNDYLPVVEFEVDILPDDRNLLDKVYDRIGTATTCHDTPSIVYRVREIKIDRIEPLRTWLPTDPPN